MTLVLAFSVLGTAEALTFNTTTRTGDLQTVLPGDDFTITFSVTPDKTRTLVRERGCIRRSQLGAVDENGANRPGHLLDNSGYLINTDGNRLNSAA